MNIDLLLCRASWTPPLGMEYSDFIENVLYNRYQLVEQKLRCVDGLAYASQLVASATLLDNRITMPVLELILQSKVNLNILDKQNESLLSKAIRANQADHVRLLLQYGADPYVWDIHGCPFMLRNNCNLTIKHMLLSYRDPQGRTALQRATDDKDDQLVKQLRSYYTKCNDILYDAIQNNDAIAAKEAIDSGADPYGAGPCGASFAQLACNKPDIDPGISILLLSSYERLV